MDWPPQIPDLSPIENLWSIMKRKVYENGRQFVSKNDLWEAIKETSAQISPEVIKKLTSSVDETLVKVLKNEGKRISCWKLLKKIFTVYPNFIYYLWLFMLKYDIFIINAICSSIYNKFLPFLKDFCKLFWPTYFERKFKNEIFYHIKEKILCSVSITFFIYLYANKLASKS